MARPFSAALCRGLIEAFHCFDISLRDNPSFPRLYAAASLKQFRRAREAIERRLFSAALCRGLIEACAGRCDRRTASAFSAALCRGLIEAAWPSFLSGRWCGAFSAALCRGLIEAGSRKSAASSRASFSAALCRGLIEAIPVSDTVIPDTVGFPRLYAAASLKRRVRRHPSPDSAVVFRGFMPRPH